MHVKSIKTDYHITGANTNFYVEWKYEWSGRHWDEWVVTVTSDHIKMVDHKFTKKFPFDTIPSIELCRQTLKELQFVLDGENEKDILSFLNKKV